MTAIALSSLPHVVHPQQRYAIAQPPVNWSGINHARMTADMETLPGNPLRALMRLRRLVGDHCTITIDRGVRGLAAFFDQSQGWIKQSLLLLQERGYIHLSYPSDGVTAITVLPPSALQASVISFPSTPTRPSRNSAKSGTKLVQRKNGTSAHQDTEYGVSALYQSGTRKNVDEAQQDVEYALSSLYQSGTRQNVDEAQQDANYDVFGCTEPVHEPVPAQSCDACSATTSPPISRPDAQNRLISDAEQIVSRSPKNAFLCTDLVQRDQGVFADCNARYADPQKEACTETIQPIYLESCKQQHGSMQLQNNLTQNERTQNERTHNERTHNERTHNEQAEPDELLSPQDIHEQLRAALHTLHADPSAIERALTGRPDGTLAEWQQDLNAAEQRPDVHSPLALALAAWAKGQRVTLQRSNERSERPRYQPRASRSGSARSWSQRDDCPIDARRAIADWGFVSGDDVSDLGVSFASLDTDHDDEVPSFEVRFPHLPTLKEAQARYEQRLAQRSR